MNLQKKDIEIIFNTLSQTSPNLPDARIRDTFLIPLGSALDQVGKDKTKIYETFCDKNEDGSPSIKEGNYHFQDNIIETVNGELKTLLEEEIAIPLDNPMVSEKVKEIIEHSAYSPKPGEVAIIDSFIEKL